MELLKNENLKGDVSKGGTSMENAPILFMESRYSFRSQPTENAQRARAFRNQQATTKMKLSMTTKGNSSAVQRRLESPLESLARAS